MKRNRHEWTTRTPDGRRVFRAWTERGDWVIQSALETRGRSGRRNSQREGAGMVWELEEPPSRDVLLDFREVLWNKYQRGRVAYKLVEKVDALLEAAEEEEPVKSGDLNEEIDEESNENVEA